MRLIISHVIDAKSEGFLLNALPTASLNLRNSDLEAMARGRVGLDPGIVDETSTDQYRWAAEDFEDEELEEEEEEEEDYDDPEDSGEEERAEDEDDDEEDDEDENEETDDEDEDEEDEEEEPPMYVEGTCCIAMRSLAQFVELRVSGLRASSF